MVFQVNFPSTLAAPLHVPSGIHHQVLAAAEELPQTGHSYQSSDGQSSRFTGVSWSRAAQKYKAEIWVDGSSHYLGHFDSEEEAALKYEPLFFNLRHAISIHCIFLGQFRYDQNAAFLKRTLND